MVNKGPNPSIKKKNSQNTFFCTAKITTILSQNVTLYVEPPFIEQPQKCFESPDFEKIKIECITALYYSDVMSNVIRHHTHGPKHT